MSWIWWPRPIIPAVWMQRQEEQESRSSTESPGQPGLCERDLSDFFLSSSYYFIDSLPLTWKMVMCSDCLTSSRDSLVLTPQHSDHRCTSLHLWMWDPTLVLTHPQQALHWLFPELQAILPFCSVY